MVRANFKQGFTLVELLVVIGVIVILVGMLLPAVLSVRESARRSSCQSKLRQISSAISSYESIWRKYPAGRVGCDDSGDEMNFSECPLNAISEDMTGASGFVSILPQLEQEALWDKLAIDDGGLWNRDLDEVDDWYSQTAKREGIQQHLDIFWCPSENSSKINIAYYPVKAATSTYAFCNGSIGAEAPGYVTKYQNDGAFIYRKSRRIKDIRDGLSNTVFVGEVVRPDIWESSNIWNYATAHADCLRNTSNPLNIRPGEGITFFTQNGAFASWHPGGALFAFGDGHIEFVNEQIDIAVYRGLSTIDGQEF